MTIFFDDKDGPHAYLSPGAASGFITAENIYCFSALEFVKTVRKTMTSKEWKREASTTVMLAIRLKFGVNIKMRERLLATGDEKLVYVSDDREWGVRKKTRGKNRLGKLLMQARDEFRGPWCDLQPWTPFQEVRLDLKDKDKLKILQGSRTFVNSRYQIVVEECASPEFADKGTVTGLSIKRLDREAIRDWRDMQRIKNELTSPEREGVEMYPDERRLVDTVNQYHLWVLPNNLHFPFGFTERFVADGIKQTNVGAGQRPFDPGQRPEDALSVDEAHALIAKKMQEAKDAGIV